MKTIELTNGVYVHIVQTTQFATNQISINFSQPKAKAHFAERFLVSNMLETVSKQYFSQTLMAKKISQMYGADFSVDVSNLGAIHNLRLNLSLVNDVFTNDKTNMVQTGLEFLQEVLLRPLGNDEIGFDLTVFSRQQEIALDEIAGLFEDREYQAIRTALTAYFQTSYLGETAFGQSESIEHVTPLMAWHELKRMYQNDRVDIMLQGDFSDTSILPLLNRFNFQPRMSQISPFEQQTQQVLQMHSLAANVNQARLVQIYQLNLTVQQRFVGYVFNALFGGLGVSRLFSNVREKAGLAYAVYSDFNPYTGVLLVSAGLELDDLAQARQMIAQQIEQLQTQPITAEELSIVKRLMINDYVVALDRPERQLDYLLSQQLTGLILTDQQWTEQINAVTVAAVQKVAQALILQIDLMLTRERN